MRDHQTGDLVKIVHRYRYTDDELIGFIVAINPGNQQYAFPNQFKVYYVFNSARGILGPLFKDEIITVN
jgi:hypothetical protein